MNRTTRAGIARLASIALLFLLFLLFLLALPGIAAAAAPSWTNPVLNGASGSPYGRYGHTVAYDAAGNNMIVFGGYTSTFFEVNDVWVLSHANDSGGTPTWTNPVLNGAPGSPVARYEHTAVYDAAGNNLIVFGGYNAFTGLFNDVWVLSHANGSGGTPTWTNTIANGAAGSPPARFLHTAVYDAAGNNLIMFGGLNELNLNDVWVLSHANNVGGTPTWTNTIANGAAGSPPARSYHTAVYDATGNNIIVFGGCANSACPSNDVWVLADASPTTTLPVTIDIRPRIAVNTISLARGTDIPVAILSSANFDATTQVDQTSLTFGHAGTETSFIYCNARATDVNGDGYKDLTCHFNGTTAGFVLGDTTGYLQGRISVRNTISGSDAVTVTQ